MTKPFAWNVRYFPDVRLFSAYLDSIPRPTWCSGLTLHHTLIPTASQWRGRTSMDALGRYYRDEAPNPDGTKGWPSGPQLFVGPDGIWQGTPVNQRGTHAGVCNANRIGIEVVGDYDRREWPPSIAAWRDRGAAALDWPGRAGDQRTPRLREYQDVPRQRDRSGCGSPRGCHPPGATARARRPSGDRRGAFDYGRPVLRRPHPAQSALV